MISTGVEALDARVGPLRRSALYTFFGPGAAGKSVAGLHLLMDGLDRGDQCVLVTRDEQVMIDSRAVFMGYSGGAITEHARLRVLRVPAVLPSSLGMTPGAAMVAWLRGQLHGIAPDRLVLDSVELLAGYTAAPRPFLDEVARYLTSTGSACYALVRTERDTEPDPEIFGPLLDRSAGIFSLAVSQRGERRFAFHTPPDGAFRTEPFGFSLRVGAGFSEEHVWQPAELEEQERRLVYVLDENGVLGDDVIGEMARQYDLKVLYSATGALSRLSAGRYGALVVAVDPYEETRAFDLVFALRKEGNAAPIVMVSPSRGLRSATRARGLRVGADDFFVAELPTDEILERIHLAWSRGRHQPGGRSQAGRIPQPLTAARVPRPMTEPEFRQTMDILLAEQPPLFFCYLEFTLADGVPDLVWPALKTRIRLGDGDIIGVLGHQRFGCFLDRITPEQTERVVERIRAAHPSLQHITDVRIIASPSDADQIRSRLEALAAGVAAPLAAPV